MNKVIEDCKHAVQEIEKIMCAQALKNVVIDNHEPGVVEEEVNKTQESEASILHSSENKPSEPLPNNHIRQRWQIKIIQLYSTFPMFRELRPGAVGYWTWNHRDNDRRVHHFCDGDEESFALNNTLHLATSDAVGNLSEFCIHTRANESY